jgi:CheY-like chemotaxis protein
VSDTGFGIPSSLHKRLFTPFDRLGAEQSSIEGTGIGLALSKQLVEAIGGHIDFESVEGEGSIFWIDLPLIEPPPLQTQFSKETMARATSGQESHTVLYIEDNLSNLHLIEKILTNHLGCQLVAAMQGGIGLELASARLPDLVLLDFHLPDLSGLEVLRRLKADSTTRDIPVVVLSADATPGRIDQLLRNGAQAYLTKPLQVRHFLQTLEEILPSKTKKE